MRSIAPRSSLLSPRLFSHSLQFYGFVHLCGVKLILRAVVMHQSAPGAQARQLVCALCRKIGCRRTEVWANERWEELLEHGRVIAILLLLRKDKNKTRLTPARKTLQCRCVTRSSCFFFPFRFFALLFFPCLKSRDWDAERLRQRKEFYPTSYSLHAHAVSDKEGEKECVMYRLCQETDVGLVGVVFISSPSFPEPFSLMTKANSPRRQQLLHKPRNRKSYLLSIYQAQQIPYRCYLLVVSHLLTFSLSFFFPLSFNFNILSRDLPWHSRASVQSYYQIIKGLRHTGQAMFSLIF